MPSAKRITKTERDTTLALLQSRLDKARQGAVRALRGLKTGLEADEIRQVYNSHIAWLEDRIGEVQASAIAEDKR